MRSRLYNWCSVLFFAFAVSLAIAGMLRAGSTDAALLIAPVALFCALSFAQRVPVTSMNLNVNVTAENAPRIEPVAREFLAFIKALTLGLVSWVNLWVVFRFPASLFFVIEGAVLVVLFASLARFVVRVRKLA